MDCSLPGSSIHGISQARIFLLQGIFPTQGLNPGLPHCRQRFYRLRHQGSPIILKGISIPNKIRSLYDQFSSDQFSSVAQWCPTLCDPMNYTTPDLPVHHQLQEFTQTHVHRVGDTIQPSHPLSSPSPPAPNPSQHQSLSQ